MKNISCKNSLVTPKIVAFTIIYAMCVTEKVHSCHFHATIVSFSWNDIRITYFDKILTWIRLWSLFRHFDNGYDGDGIAFGATHEYEGQESLDLLTISGRLFGCHFTSIPGITFSSSYSMILFIRIVNKSDRKIKSTRFSMREKLDEANYFWNLAKFLSFSWI